MPELPEVETTRRGVTPHILDATVLELVVRQRRLRWPVPAALEQILPGQVIERVDRRGKYLLLRLQTGTILLHLGMSGSLVLAEGGHPPPRPHDHVELHLGNGKHLRFHDPRRFGCFLWVEGDPLAHPLLAHMGPEPLAEDFHGEYLFQRSRNSAMAVKTFIMNSRIVAGVGNIYANEALFLAGINPKRKAGAVARGRYDRLAEAVKVTLETAIEAGGTTLRDFVGGDGRPGYFRQSLHVYGRALEPCGRCGRGLKEIRLGQRSTVYCGHCQR